MSSEPSDSSLARRSTHRRGFLLGAAGVASALSVARMSIAAQSDFTYDDKTSGDRDDSGDNTPADGAIDAPAGSGEQGVALLRSWMAGQITGVPISNPAWVFTVSQVGNYAFYIPGGWQVAEFTDPTPGDFSDGFTTTTRVDAPNDRATFYVYDVQALLRVVTMPEFAQGVADGLTGGSEFELLAEDYYSMLAPNDAAFFAIRFGEQIATMQAFGSVVGNQGSGLETSSYSSTIQVGRADRFDELVVDYFLPMLSNFQRFSGGSGDPTPTPTPTP